MEKRKISTAAIQMLVKAAAAADAAEKDASSTSDAKKKLIEDLRVDMQKEYKAMIQYVNHAAMIEGAQWDSIAKEILTHADEEYGHAKALAERIQFLGGDPSVTIESVETASTPEEMLNQDLKGEIDAIERYKERIVQAEELNDFGTSEVIRGILLDEENHQNDLETTLGIRSKRK
jgi:bacterioferritin